MPTTYYYNGGRLNKNAITPSATADSSSIRVNLRSGRMLGKGEWGSVYAVRVSTRSVSYRETQLVVKTGRYRAHLKAQLKREAEIFRQVHGDPVHLAFQYGEYYLVCKRLPGRALHEWIDSSEYSCLEKLEILDAVYAALGEQLHSKGIFHGDLKPQNILVHRKRDGSYEVNFIDFGWSYRRGEHATSCHVDPWSNHYWHPDRQRKNPRLAPHPFQDIYSLTKYLCVWSRWRAPARLSPLYKGTPITIEDMRRAIQLAQAVERERPLLELIRSVYDSFGREERLYYLQLAAINDMNGLLAFLQRLKPEEFRETTTEQLSILELHCDEGISRYHRELRRYCFSEDNIKQIASERLEDLPGTLPPYFARANQEWLVEVKQSARRKVVRALLRNIEANQSFRLLLLAHGRDSLQPLLQELPGYDRFAASMDETELETLWDSVTANLRVPSSRDGVVKALAQLASQHDLVAYLAEQTGITLAVTDDDLRRQLTEAAATLQKETAEKALLSLTTPSTPDNRLKTVIDYWQSELTAQSLPEVANTYEAWQTFSQVLCLSVAIIKGFQSYEAFPGKRVNSVYREFALSDPREHTLPRLCKVVAEQTGRLHRDSFFILILDQQGSWGQCSALMPLLESADLVECFEKRHYDERDGRPNPSLFSSASKASRSRIRNAVIAYAREHPVTAREEHEADAAGEHRSPAFGSGGGSGSGGSDGSK